MTAKYYPSLTGPNDLIRTSPLLEPFQNYPVLSLPTRLGLGFLGRSSLVVPSSLWSSWTRIAPLSVPPSSDHRLAMRPPPSRRYWWSAWTLRLYDKSKCANSLIGPCGSPP
jgi:hypothetical protein